MIPPRIDTVVEWSDRRRLAYAEYGEPTGAPVFVCHGLPGSRLAWGLLPDNPVPPGLRIVAPDHPGYVRSDPEPGQSRVGPERSVHLCSRAKGQLCRTRPSYGRTHELRARLAVPELKDKLQYGF